MSLGEMAWAQSEAQWSLVSSRPKPLTIDDEQPIDRRTDAAWTRASQAAVMSTPSAAFAFAAGKLSNVHSPSSARADPEAAAIAVSAAANWTNFIRKRPDSLAGRPYHAIARTPGVASM